MSHLLAAGPAASIEGLIQVGELGLGLLPSAVIGLEREVRQKSAGLRTSAEAQHAFQDLACRSSGVPDRPRRAAQVRDQ